MKLKTARATGCYNPDGSLDGVSLYTEDTPVLVVPEAAVKGCKHDDITGSTSTPSVEVCRGCGSSREWIGKWSRWQRPRILRAGRQR